MYFAVVIGLLSINWGSELIWSALNDDNSDSDFSSLIKIAKAIPNIIDNQPDKVNGFVQDSGLSLSMFNVEDIAWLPAQKKQLQQGEVVVNYDQHDQPVFYIKASNNNMLYQLSGFDNPTQNNEGLKFLILTISYLFLAAFIALWTRPVWRDLLKLKSMANHILDGNLEVSCTVNKRSPTAVVVQTFQGMANRITRLLVEQTQLVNAVSHELRTPLSRLRFSLALMDDKNAQQVAEIHQDVDEMENLIEEMLNYSRIETLEQVDNKSNVNINELLNNQIEKHQRGTHKSLAIETNSAITFICNGDLLERAIQNLLTNAIRYANEAVLVTAEIENNQLHISVIDDGDGIDEAQTTDLFKAFTRLDKSRNKQKGGFGLGLAIVKRIMDWHKGICAIERSEQGGAKFTLILPIK